MKFFPGIAGLTLALFTNALACQPVNDVPVGPSSMQMIQVGHLVETKLAIEGYMLTQVAPWAVNNIPVTLDRTSFIQLETKVVAIDTQIEGWRTGRLQYYEDFNDQSADGIEITSGQFIVVPAYDGNSFWQSTSNRSISKIRLPTSLRFYVIEFKMQGFDSTGLGGIFLGDVSSDCPDYEISIARTIIKLSERDSSCLLADYHEYPIVLSENIWHKFRVEVKQDAISMYLDEIPQHPPIIVNGDEELLTIDTIGFWTCCDHTLLYPFLFDDIQVWSP